MKKIVFFTMISCLILVGKLQAQSLTTISYSVGFSSGDLNKFISNASFRGVAIDYEHLIKPNIGIGGTTGWQTFYTAKDYATYTLDNVSLTGKQWRYSSHLPILVRASYYFKPKEKLNPFFGLGIGTIYTVRTTDMGIYRFEQDAWNFALQPTLGILIETHHDFMWSISGRYNYGMQAGNELQSAQSYFSLNVGFTFGRFSKY